MTFKELPMSGYFKRPDAQGRHAADVWRKLASGHAVNVRTQVMHAVPPETEVEKTSVPR